MIILQINSVVNSGSTGRIVEGIGRIAMKNGWKSYIAYARNDQVSKSEKIKIGNNINIAMHGLRTRFLDQHGFGSYKDTKKFIQQIKIINPDIIHLHNIHGYYLNIDLLFQYLSIIGKPIIWTLHDCWPLTGHCAHFSFVGCNKWEKHCEKCPQIRSYPASFFIDNSYKNYEQKKELFTSVRDMTIVPVSNWLGEIVKKSFLKEYPVKVIHNGIDTTIFKPRADLKIREKYGIKKKFIILGVANIWGERKGINDFLKFSSLLKEDEIIILVGLKQNQLKKLPSNIIGVERTESVEELVDFYSSADVFVNPTWEDNFPTTNLESMACGTPVITYKTGGCHEAITTETGFVIEQGDINELRHTIDKIRNTGKEFYSVRCSKHTKRYFDKNDRFDEYIQLYNSNYKTVNQ